MIARWALSASAAAPGQHVVERAVGLGRVPEEVEQPRLGPAAGERVEPVVEAPVRGELAGDVAGRGCLGAVVGGRLERAQVGGRRPFDAEQERIRLEQAPEAIHLLELGEVELGHRVAATRPVGDETLAGERAQRLPDRDQAHAGALGPRLLVDPLARPELAVEDRRAQRRRRAILRGRPAGGRRARDGCDRHRRYRNAGVPVSAPPTTSVCTSCVPS